MPLRLTLIVSGNCMPGSFNEGTKCTKCPMGSYQDQNGQTSCKNCSQGYTTKHAGTKNITDCIRKYAFATFLSFLYSMSSMPKQYVLWSLP